MRRRILNLFIFLSLFGVSAFATTFIPLPLDRQLKSSSGVIHAIYQGSSFKKISSGEVVTSASFKILQSSGIKNNEIVNRNDFKVIYPGGNWQGLVYKVPGAPSFFEGEEVVLILHKGSRGYTINNLKMGKYEIFEEDGQRYLSSSAFKSHPKLGKISFREFESKLMYTFGSDFKTSHHDKYIGNSSKDKKASRSIASEDESEKEKHTTTMSIYWLAVIFGLMGSYSAYVMKRK